MRFPRPTAVSLSTAAACLSMHVALAGGLGAQPRTPIVNPAALTPHQQLSREIYKELVEINTGVETGNITTAAVAMAARFKAAGIPAADIFVGGPRPEKHNVVARIRGKGGPNAPKPLLLLAHIDVVEALKADWSADLDPFVFTERDGYYYGRGTADDKAMASIFVANVYRMKREGFVPDRDIIIALTADEESGPANGVDWLLKNHKNLVDAALVINEGGGGTLRDGKPLFNAIQATEKITTNFTLRVTNKGGHSSVPRDDNAITSLSDALSRVGRYKFAVQLNEVTRAFFSQTAALEEPAMGKGMAALVANPADQAAIAVVTADPKYNSMLRTTCVATELKGGHATNALPQLAEANVNCRVYPTQSAESVRAELAAAIGDTTVQVIIRSQRPASPPSALLPEVMQNVDQITKALWGPMPIIPIMSTGATDSRFFRAIGVPAFGVSGLFSDPTVDARAHGRDERMSVKSYYEGQEFLYRLTKALASNVVAQ
ncbi:MAG: M20/M25/M40 family metallo-hydrolase [Gemmatimonadota bacterium]|jgi:acetylornithine deacetylase/succinyl-diaminopimelate desuccinylase-like protein|nr:M20/M25/M40 family metallo-hydrolase [Gemmatimonadota bacterium]MDQ8167797.1 M20/M25/M40 family metallo-hydrolase [Gemmatimonadota bacterium]MDQ8172248.1 M20/M25/M40 family metallo-hydrolase [Gemmatimonadota bacterium]